ncbi:MULTISPECIES: type II toxin-antitoxin system VapC family toxin [Shinella]|jgi:PIN domain nuclease of toxin-antitoxin system|uniref:PIN domain nuclease of toxin-antitoxin system n=1 Tax=Shinella granuli TaxID=323621 RepID=A0A4R2D229_SHIGR|nr:MULTISPECIES: type II toxin-antitoxin system VapC family toxin [Shinella]ANH03785.1 twitching motility protein PilT [Shinella sp. HZN7]TCN47881.1 PIN domain nuclease of toxin-antitoxin system [Shinella granuli]
MRLLIDTHLLIWAAEGIERLSAEAVKLMGDQDNVLVFSAASIWEVAIKQALNRQDFSVDASLLRRGLIESGYEELPIAAAHAIAVADLPGIHNDPFDRMLIAQARTEGLLLLTADRRLASYPGPIRLV